MSTTHTGRAANVGKRGFSPVIVVTPPPPPPVGEFSCDAPGCEFPHGTGPRALLWHARRYGHNRFTPR